MRGPKGLACKPGSSSALCGIFSPVPRSMGRCGGAGGKGANNAGGKGSGKGSSKSQGPQGKGRGAGSSTKKGWEGEFPVMVKNVTKLTKMMAGLQAKFDKLGVNAEPLKERGAPWTCKHCKAEKCFASRSECYKCGKPRDAVMPIPPGLGVKAAADKVPGKQAPVTQPMEEDKIEEETLEDRITEVEENLRILKGKESAWAKTQRADLEALLKNMKEQQKLARPLPARLQAATDRVAMTGQAVKDGEAEIGAIEAALQEARQKLEENHEKHRAALQELEAVKQVAGAEPVGEAEKGLAAGMLAALASRSITGPDAEAFLASGEVLQPRKRWGGDQCGPGACSRWRAATGNDPNSDAAVTSVAGPPGRARRWTGQVPSEKGGTGTKGEKCEPDAAGEPQGRAVRSFSCGLLFSGELPVPCGKLWCSATCSFAGQ